MPLFFLQENTDLIFQATSAILFQSGIKICKSEFLMVFFFFQVEDYSCIYSNKIHLLNSHWSLGPIFGYFLNSIQTYQIRVSTFILQMKLLLLIDFNISFSPSLLEISYVLAVRNKKFDGYFFFLL